MSLDFFAKKSFYRGVSFTAGLSIGYFAENSRRKKLKLKTIKTETQEFFSKSSKFRQFLTMFMLNFEFKKHVLTILLKVTNIFPKTQEFFFKTQRKFPETPSGKSTTLGCEENVLMILLSYDRSVPA